MKQSTDPYNWLKIERVEFLIDGIIAIVMTLLVLDIRVPVNEAIQSDKEVLQVLVGVLPKVLSYVMSFLVLAVFWMSYGAQFQHIHKVDRRLYLHIAFVLLGISLIPFTTAFLSEHMYSKVSIFLLWVNFTIIGITLPLHWRYAVHNGLVKTSAAEIAVVDRAFMRRGKVAMASYTVAALLSFVSTYISIGFIIIVQLAFALGWEQWGLNNLPEEPVSSH